jgi:hypothetical protein
MGAADGQGQQCAALRLSPPAVLLAAFALLGTGCLTVGYDFLKQQATVTVTPSTKGLAK